MKSQRNHQRNEITSTTTSPAQRNHQHNEDETKVVLLPPYFFSSESGRLSSKARSMQRNLNKSGNTEEDSSSESCTIGNWWQPKPTTGVGTKCTSPGKICVSSHANQNKPNKKQHKKTNNSKHPNGAGAQTKTTNNTAENLPMPLHFKAKNEFICPEFTQRMQLNCLPNSPR